MKLLIKVIVFVFIFPIFSLAQETYYVRKDGSDSNNGLSDNAGGAFLTIQHAIDQTDEGGDYIYVRTGTYHERLTFTQDGSSGNPITIDGESGTIVDGSDAVNAGSWVTAPEIGTGVYKQTSFSPESGTMYVLENGAAYSLPRCEHSNCDTTLATATDATYETYYLEVTVNWWDGIEAMYKHASSGSTLYVRFGDNSDPGDKTIRVSPDNDAVISLFSDSYITLKDLTVRGGFRGIWASGAAAHDIVIDNCIVYATGRQKIYVNGDAYNVEIKNSTIYGSGGWDLGSYKPGAWVDASSGTAPYAQAIKEWIYYCYKTFISSNGDSTQVDTGITFQNAGSGNSVHDSEIYESMSGLEVLPDASMDVYNNEIHGHSSLGIYFSETNSANIYNNLVYDNANNLRFGKCELYSNRGPYNIYNNRFHNPEGVGGHIKFHWSPGSTSPSVYTDFFFYHNSFAGGYRVMSIGGIERHDGMKGARWINNIFTSENILYEGGISGFWNNASWFEVFNYNWVGGAYYYSGNPAWGSATGNIYAEDSYVWSNSSMPDFVLPGGHAAIESGIDISDDPFTIDEVQYNALPGMSPGYYSGSAPNMGYVFDPATARGIIMQ